MEVLGCCGSVDDFHTATLSNFSLSVEVCWRLVIGIGQGQVSLNTAGRVLWACAIISVRKQHHKAILDVPFSFS